MSQKTDLIRLSLKGGKSPKRIVLDGQSLTLFDVIAVSRQGSEVVFTSQKKILQKVQACYERMMDDVKKGIPIYGCNTGYGGRASHVLNHGSPKERIEIAKKISEGIIHIDVSVGPTFSPDIVRGAMAIRINMLMKGVSAIKLADLEIYRNMLNAHLTPVVNQYGGIGASGDLAHNCRVLSTARQLEGTQVWDQNMHIHSAPEALRKSGIPELKIDPKAGLGLVNGDNFSTSLAASLAYDTMNLFIIAQVVGAMVVEVLKGTDRSFHQLLSMVRPHTGQGEVARFYRYLLRGSKLAYQEMKGHQLRPPGVKVQDGYSLRGISQYHGVNYEKLLRIIQTIEINANSVSDNPLWVSPEFASSGEKPWQWVSGGNFLAMYMVDVMDEIRKICTQIVKMNDRHLMRMVTPHESNGLPANLSDKLAPTQCAFKGTQIQSGMFDVYSSLLSVPVSTFFGIHEEANQDITSHALTSGILGLENLRITRYSLAQNLVAVMQAVDLRGGGKLLSPRTQPIYEYVRSKIGYVTKERPLHYDIQKLYELLANDGILNIVRKEVLADYDN